MRSLEDKSVLLCVGGGIAAYKTPDLVRRLQDAGADVRVAMTRAAREFVTPLVLQTLSRHPVATELLDPAEEAAIGHIHLADSSDVVLVAPATADLIARAAAGMADDIVTAVLLATRAPVVVAPSMNGNMLDHPAVQRNLATIESFGYRVVPSDVGQLACGYEGAGRLPDPEVLVEAVATAIGPRDLEGVKIAVSAGPTREPVDPVRYLSNRSSGLMGFEIARAARRRGAEVELVAGPTALATPPGVQCTSVETAAQMGEAMRTKARNSDVVVMVAAVADYRVAKPADRKIKKVDTERTLELERTEDVLASLAALPGSRLLVGFAAETHEVARYAREKLARKGLDLIVANDVGEQACGFEVATNRALLIDRDGNEQDSGLVGKDELADLILDRIVALRGQRDANRGTG